MFLRLRHNVHRRQCFVKYRDAGICRACFFAEDAAVLFSAAYAGEKAEQVARVVREHFATPQCFKQQATDGRQHLGKGTSRSTVEFVHGQQQFGILIGGAAQHHAVYRLQMGVAFGEC